MCVRTAALLVRAKGSAKRRNKIGGVVPLIMVTMREWVVAVPDGLVKQLGDDFRSGALLDSHGRRSLDEAQVGSINGLRVEIFAREHPPPHFRVFYQGESANFDVCSGEPLTAGLTKWLRNIRKWHQTNRTMLVEQWNLMRPSDCPVGPVNCD